MTPEESMREMYDDAYFDRDLHRHHWFTNNAAKRERRMREVFRMLEPRAGDRILEIGCGAGEHALALAHAAGTVIGNDAAHAGSGRARDRGGRELTANAHFAVADAAALPLASASMDKVAAIDFVEHVDDVALSRILREVRRVLVDDGIVAVYTPCLTHYVERLKAREFMLRQIPGHIAVRAPAHCASLLAAAGFAVRACRFLPSDYPLFGVIDRLLAPLPGIGDFFRFRICMVAAKA
jgi:cyclopropane fatty-acyl-phospholipid synthase-like methyltransferase